MSMNNESSECYLYQEHFSESLRKQCWSEATSMLESPKFQREIQKNLRSEPCTILHDACYANTIPQSVIDTITQYFPELCHVEDEDGNLPLHLLCEDTNNGSATYPSLSRPDLMQHLIAVAPETSLRPMEESYELPFHVLMKNLIGSNGVETALNVIQALPQAAFYNKHCSVLHQVNDFLPPFEVYDTIMKKYPEISRINSNGNTLLHIIVSHPGSSAALVQNIVHMYPEACRIQDEQGNLPLHLVNSQDESSEIIGCLVPSYPEALYIRNFSGHIPLRSERITASSNRVKVLLRHGLDYIDMRQLLLQCNGYGMNSVHEFYHDLQRVATDQVLNGSLSMSDLESFGRTSSVFSKELTQAIESLFYTLRVAIYGSVEYSQSTPHEASFWAAFPLFTKLLLRMCPELATHRDCDGNFPLHIISNSTLAKPHPQTCSQCNCEAGGLSFRLPNNTTCCKNCVGFFGPKVSQYCTVEYNGTQLLEDLLNISPSAAKEKDARGNYPLHTSLKTGKTWSTGIASLMKINPAVVDDADKENDMVPFLLAATAKCHDGKEELSTIFELIKSKPSLVKPCI